MRTEKQIELEEKERGKEFLSLLDSLDTISFNYREVYEKLNEFVKIKDEWDIVPVLYNGVLKFEKNDIVDLTLYYSFEIEKEEETYEVTIDTFSEIDGSGDTRWRGLAAYSIPQTVRLKELDYDIIAVYTPEMAVYDRQGNKRMLQKAMQKGQDFFESARVGNDFIAVFSVLSYILQNPEIKEVKEKIGNRKKPTGQAKQEKAEKKSNRHKVNLNGFKIVTESQNTATKLKSHKKFTAESWGVRGHYRHYKSGKVVYIDAYRKGKNRDKGDGKGKDYNLDL